MAEPDSWQDATDSSREEARGVAQLGFGILLIVALLASWKATHRVDPALTAAETQVSAEQEDSPEGAPELPGAHSATANPLSEKSAADDEMGNSTTLDTAEEERPCYEGLILPPGWQVLKRCFAVRESAKAIVSRLRKSNVHATSVKTWDGAYVVRYQPFTEAQARAAGEAALRARQPRGGDLYELVVLHDETIGSFTWQISMPCPEGWLDAGRFKLTAYVLAQEEDFPATPRINNPCGLEGDYSKPFLFGQGVRMQGSGLSNEGDIIHFRGKGCFELLDCARTAIGRCARAGRTIAVDPKVISLGSEVLVEDIGYRIAEDTGGGIRGDHLDIYYGTELRLRQAWAHTREDRRVCVKPRQMAL